MTLITVMTVVTVKKSAAMGSAAAKLSESRTGELGRCGCRGRRRGMLWSTGPVRTILERPVACAGASSKLVFLGCQHESSKSRSQA